MTSPQVAGADLPRPPGVFRRYVRAHPRLLDAGLVVLYLALTTLIGTVSTMGLTESGEVQYIGVPDYMQWPEALSLVLVMVVSCAALMLRRRYPLYGLLAVLASMLLVPQDAAPASAAALAVAVLLYSVPVYRSVRAGWVGYAAALVMSVAVPMLLEAFKIQVMAEGSLIAASTSWVSLIITSALTMAVPVIMGINVGNRRRYVDAIVDRANQLARERDQLARLAVAEERTRIAREMHDVVAHSLSVMVALSEGAAQVSESRPEAASGAMRQSAETGRQALAEMRRLIGALREPSGSGRGTLVSGDEEGTVPMAPAPGIRSLPELVEVSRAAGLDVHLSLRGVAGSELSDHSRELAIYRVVQEGLTNALRHAGPGAVVWVSVQEGKTGVLVQVRDEGTGKGAATLTDLGAGQGLAGLAERLRLLGGTLEAGPHGKGWLLTAHLPGESPAYGAAQLPRAASVLGEGRPTGQGPETGGGEPRGE